MKNNNWLLFGICLLISACPDNNDNTKNDDGIVITDNIRFPDGASQLYSLSEGDFLSGSYDIYLYEIFDPTDPDASGSYPFVSKIGLNNAAGVSGALVLDSDFTTATRPDSGFAMDDSTELIIGSNWYGQYDGVTHFMAGNGTIYFLFTADNNWVKLEIIKASTSFFIQYSIENDDRTYGDPDTVEVPFYALEHGNPGALGTSSDPTYFSFTNGLLESAPEWHFGFGNLLNFSVELQSLTYVPTALINFDLDISVSVIDGSVFEDIIVVPENIIWWSSPDDIKKLWSCAGDGVVQLDECSDAIMIYDFPTYNSHLMQILDPTRIYLFSINGTIYKVKLEEDSYSSSNDGQLIWFMTEKL
ncbi:MAG: hypothetical protein HOB40_09055 [Candidatus Marinimicrobia bacterium]|nr:hypothetical protein [Candidatus Neomarinimicrobiota bacterium]MBT5461356.1 hypothetical protein [Candidatus Neomarinimicrobiota bacterium]MBT6633101.1 hypothetical protein [Candidatus Neomarinimicrobiota bacterium]